MTDEKTKMLAGVTYAECPLFRPSFTVAKCVRVLDGTTLHLAADTEGHGIVRYPSRLIGVATADLRARSKPEKTLAKIAREELKTLVYTCVCRVHIHGVDKYGRLLVRIQKDDTDVADLLIQRGVAVKHDGDSKPSVNWDDLLKLWLRCH